jgi:hypothetical protein
MKRALLVSSLMLFVSFGSLFDAIVHLFRASSQTQTTDIGVRIDPDG